MESKKNTDWGFKRAYVKILFVECGQIKYTDFVSAKMEAASNQSDYRHSAITAVCYVGDTGAFGNINRTTIHDWVKCGKLKPKKLKGKVFFYGVILRGWLMQEL